MMQRGYGFPANHKNYEALLWVVVSYKKDICDWYIRKFLQKKYEKS